MTHFAYFAAFAAVAIGMALTPGPNMAYLVSRSICQGRAAGFVSLGSVVLGFIANRRRGQIGRRALNGKRRPKLNAALASPKTAWTSIMLTEWYGGQSRKLESVRRAADGAMRRGIPRYGAGTLL